MARRRSRAGIAVILAALGATVMITAGTADAMVVKDHSLISVPVTSGYLSFVGNGYIAGPAQTYSTATGFPLTMSQEPNGVHIGGTNAAHFWGLDLRAPGTSTMTEGTYTDAERYPFNGAHAGFDLSGDGRGCNTERADFTVWQLTKDAGGAIQAIRATFVQHCEGGMQITRGQVAINVDPVALPAEPGAMVLTGGDRFNTGQYQFRSADGDRVLAQSEHGGNSLTVGAVNAVAVWSLEVAAPVGQPLTVGTYTGTVSPIGTAQPALALSSFIGRICTFETGNFRIDQLHVAVDGSVDLLDLSFHRVCDGSVVGDGRILINLTLPPLNSSVAIASSGAVQTIKLTSFASFSGTLSCSDNATYTVTGTLTQVKSSGTLSKPFTLTVTCAPGGTGWSTVVRASSFAGFATGPATVSVTATPIGQGLRSSAPPASASSTVTLGRILPPRRPLTDP